MAVLPRYLTMDTLPGFVGKWPATGKIKVDFNEQRFVHPVGTAALCCLIRKAEQDGRNVELDFERCQNVSYWDRMGFFDHFPRFRPPNEHGRRDPAGRFSEIKRVSDIGLVDRLTDDLVGVVQPESRARQVYSHVVSEALNNVCQHSTQEGFCASQYYEKTNECRFSIVDFGVGLRESLRRHSPHDDRSAILLSLTVGVTGTNPTSQRRVPSHMRNRGVGLAAILELVTKNYGSLAVWSGTALYRANSKGASLTTAPKWPGTLVAAKIPRQMAGPPFHDIMRTLSEALNRRPEAGEEET